MTAVTAFVRSWRFANITSWTVSPTTVYVGLAPSTGDIILAVEPEDVGRWNRDAFDELGGPLERRADGWSTRAWPGEVWSDDDVVKEARRLGFDR